MIKKQDLKPAFSSTLATLLVQILHPLELVKIRMQSHDGGIAQKNIVPKYGNILIAIKQIYLRQGWLGLYRGVVSNFFSTTLATALFFTFYQKRKKSYQLTNSIFFIQKAAFEAAIISTILTQPLWVIKTRLVMKQQNSGFFKVGKEIYKTEGILGFGRGFGLSLVLSFNGSFLIISYQMYKRILNPYIKDPFFISGMLSKFSISLLLYPISTIRTRIQQEQQTNATKLKYTGIKHIAMSTLKEERVMGLYKGFSANILKNILQKGLYFASYERINRAIEA